VVPFLLYWYDPDPPEGELITMVPLESPKQVTSVEVTVAVICGSCEMVSPLFRVRVQVGVFLSRIITTYVFTESPVKLPDVCHEVPPLMEYS
jgi:hypothetical protein